MLGKARSVAKKTRGKAARDRQLSRLQRDILQWLYSEEEQLEFVQTLCSIGINLDDDGALRKLGILGVAFTGREDVLSWKRQARSIGEKGVVWSSKRFYSQQSEDALAPTKSQVVTLSTSLSGLASRGLVSLHDAAEGVGLKRRVSHVRLTGIGKKAAEVLIRSKGLSQRELVEQSPEYENRRELWRLRRLWKQSQVDYRYAMRIFENTAIRIAREKGAQSAAELPYPDGYDEDHYWYLEELEDEMYELELLLGKPEIALAVPSNWRSDGGFYKDELESLPQLENIEWLVPF